MDNTDFTGTDIAATLLLFIIAVAMCLGGKWLGSKCRSKFLEEDTVKDIDD